MLTTLIMIVAMFSAILVTHNYVLEAIYKDVLNEPKSRNKIAD
jgi:hypothetical protein